MKAFKVWSGESADNGMYTLAETFKEAVEKIATYNNMIKTIKSATVGITIIDCGRCHCGRLAELDVLQDGECLLCQKIRADAQQDKYAEEREDEDKNNE